MIPLTWRGTVEIPARNVPRGDARVGLLAIGEELRTRGVRVVQVSDTRLDFVNPRLVRQSSLSLLVGIDGGSVETRTEAGRVVVSYRLNFVRLVVLTALLCGVVVSMMVIEPSPAGPRPGWLSMAFFWASVLGANYVISVVRFRSFVRRSMIDREFETKGQTG